MPVHLTDTLSLSFFYTAVVTYRRSLHCSLNTPRSFKTSLLSVHSLVQHQSVPIPYTKLPSIPHQPTSRSATRFSTIIITTASALATSILPRPQAADCFRRPSILQAFDLPAIKTPPAIVEDKQLPSIGHDISRPSSSSTVASYTQQRHGSHHSIQLPALSTLASVASNSPAAHNNSNDSNSNTRRDTPERKMPSPPRYVVVVLPRLGPGTGERCEPRLRSCPLQPAVASLISALATLAPQLFASGSTDMSSSKPSNGLSMTYATSAPATSGGQPGSPVRFAYFSCRDGALAGSCRGLQFLLLSNR